MYFNNTFKYLWWVIVLISGIYMIHLRYDHIKYGTVGAFDTVLIALIAGLMLIPFFSEMNILGIKLKQELSSFKKEVKDDVKEIREAIKNIVDVNNYNKFSPNIYFGNAPVPPDNQLEKIEEFIKKTMHQIMEQNFTGDKPTAELVVPEENMLLFSARYNIEKEIRRIWFNRFGEYNDERVRYMPINRMVSDLIKHEVLPPSFNGVIKEIYAVCSPAVHGEQPTESQVNFIKDVAKEVISTLKIIR